MGSGSRILGSVYIYLKLFLVYRPSRQTLRLVKTLSHPKFPSVVREVGSPNLASMLQTSQVCHAKDFRFRA